MRFRIRESYIFGSNCLRIIVFGASKHHRILLVLVMVGRDYHPQTKAILTWYVRGTYYQLRDYMLFTTFFRSNLRNPLVRKKSDLTRSPVFPCPVLFDGSPVECKTMPPRLAAENEMLKYRIVIFCQYIRLPHRSPRTKQIIKIRWKIG